MLVFSDSEPTLWDDTPESVVQARVYYPFDPAHLLCRDSCYTSNGTPDRQLTLWRCYDPYRNEQELTAAYSLTCPTFSPKIGGPRKGKGWCVGHMDDREES